MVAIHFDKTGFGGADMKEKKREHHIYDNSEAGERRYQQKLKTDQIIYQAFLSSVSQFFCVPFCPYDFPVTPQTISFAGQPEDNRNKETKKNK